MAHATTWQEKRDAVEARDGFLTKPLGDDDDQWIALGHVDRTAFLRQLRDLWGLSGTDLNEATAVDVYHCYVIVIEQGEEVWFETWIPSADGETSHVVGADDEGAQPATMLDL